MVRERTSASRSVPCGPGPRTAVQSGGIRAHCLGRTVTLLWIGIGGFVGANARYVLGRAIIDRYGYAFPWGTLTINVVGSLLIGMVLELIAQRAVGDPAYRLLLVVGFLGGFTTFSTFAFEVVTLLEDERWLRAGAYVVASNVLAVAACLAGVVFVRRFA
jgi:fluoride exporter